MTRSVKEDGDGDGGVATAGIVGDTDWRERAARARKEQRGRVASKEAWSVSLCDVVEGDNAPL